MTRIAFFKGTARAAICAAALGGSSALMAQAVAPAEPVTVAPAPAPVAVTPPPAVPTIAPQPTVNDSIAPSALADIASEQRAAAPKAKAAPVRAAVAPRAAATPAPAVSPSPEPAEAAPTLPAEAPIASDSVVDPVATAPIVNNVEAAPVEQPSGETDWGLWAAIAAALGLAGAGAAFASRRRRPVEQQEERVILDTPRERLVTEHATIARPVAAAPVVADPVFTSRQPLRDDSSVIDPLFSRKADVTTPVTDPLFTRPREPVGPVTDPLFLHKVENPPVTDPLFKDHPDYVGPGSRRNWGIDRPAEGEAVPDPEYAQ